MNNVLFMGRKPVAAKALRWLANQSSVNIVGVITDSHLKVSPTSDAARELAIPLWTRQQAESAIQSAHASIDLSLSMLYWQKIRTPIIEAAKKGVINFHPAPLPEYKGTAGYNLAILEDKAEWAVSSHYVDESIDTGPIIKLSSFGIDRNNETAQSLEEKSQDALLDLFKAVTARALSSESVLPATTNEGGRYVSRKEMEAMKEVKDGDDVERKIRAFWFPPYDGAFKIVDGVKCTLVHRGILETLAKAENSNLFTGASEA